MSHKIFYPLLTFLFLILLAGCGPQISPEELISKATDAAGELETYRFEMIVTINEDEETRHSNIQGEFASPDKSHMISVSHDETEEYISIGQTLYRRAYGSDSWEIEQSHMATAFANTRNMIVSTSEMLDTLIDLTKLPDTTIDGVSCYHFRGNADMEAQVMERIANLEESSPSYDMQLKSLEMQRQWEHNLEFWIGKDDHLLRRVDAQQDMFYIDNIGDDDERQVNIKVAYSYRFIDFNQPIQIESPITE